MGGALTKTAQMVGLDEKEEEKQAVRPDFQSNLSGRSRLCATRRVV